MGVCSKCILKWEGSSLITVFIAVQEECANFEYMLWFESLLFYGFEENSTLQRGDGDISLLPSIVEKVILSKLTGSSLKFLWHNHSGH